MSTIPLNGAATPTRFEDCPAGTEVELSGIDFPDGPRKATVVQMLPEYGPTSIPHLLVRMGSDTEATLISSSGRIKVKILRSTRDLATLPAPTGSVVAKLRPATVTAMQFIGGVERASAIIQFTAGKASVSYDQGDESIGAPESMTLRGFNSETGISIGDWVVVDERGEVQAYDTGRFAELYTVDAAASPLAVQR